MKRLMFTVYVLLNVYLIQAIPDYYDYLYKSPFGYDGNENSKSFRDEPDQYDSWDSPSIKQKSMFEERSSSATPDYYGGYGHVSKSYQQSIYQDSPYQSKFGGESKSQGFGFSAYAESGSAGSIGSYKQTPKPQPAFGSSTKESMKNKYLDEALSDDLDDVYGSYGKAGAGSVKLGPGLDANTEEKPKDTAQQVSVAKDTAVVKKEEAKQLEKLDIKEATSKPVTKKPEPKEKDKPKDSPAHKASAKPKDQGKVKAQSKTADHKAPAKPKGDVKAQSKTPANHKSPEQHEAKKPSKEQTKASKDQAATKAKPPAKHKGHKGFFKEAEDKVVKGFKSLFGKKKKNHGRR